MDVLPVLLTILSISAFGCDAQPAPGEQCIIGPYIPGLRLGRYIYHTEKKSWEEATVICALEGAHLAIINTPEEEAGIKNLVSKVGISGSYAYIGMHDLNKEGVFETVEGDLLYGIYYSWSNGEPNNSGGNEHCGNIVKSAKLNDGQCAKPRPFLCEMYINDCFTMPCCA